MTNIELAVELRQIACDLKQINEDRERERKEKRDRSELWDEIYRLKKAVKQFAGGEHE